jgi:hypothetical protein
MLGNNADAFFNTAMPTSVVSGGNVKMARNEMPAPRSLALSGQVTCMGAEAEAPKSNTMMIVGVAAGIAALLLLCRRKKAA